MALGNCPDEIQDCDLGSMTVEQLFRKLLRADGNCLALAMSAAISNPIVLDTTDEFIQSLEAEGEQTLVGLETAYNLWKTNNPTKTVIRELFVTGGNGITSIKITYI